MVSGRVNGRSGQRRDQVPEQGARKSLRKRVSEWKARNKRRGDCWNVSLRTLPRLNHHRPHQHAYCNDEPLLRSDPGQHSIAVCVCLCVVLFCLRTGALNVSSLLHVCLFCVDLICCS